MYLPVFFLIGLRSVRASAIVTDLPASATELQCKLPARLCFKAFRPAI
jgi:hypothetical protein